MNNSKIVENGELDESMTSGPSDEINNDDFLLEYDAHMFHKIQTLGSTIENKKFESHVFARARSIVEIF